MHPSACEICQQNSWSAVYQGAIRDGVFGKLQEGATVYRCNHCGVERLDEDMCPDATFYESTKYRAKLAQGLDSNSYFQEQDLLQIHTLKTLWPRNLRHSTVADIGCGGGSLLDHLRGYSAQQIAVEPYEIYRTELQERGYIAYPYADAAAKDWTGKIDLATSIQVIEHTDNPRTFLESIRPLLAEDGHLIISTPNRDDILFDLLPDDFPTFFYRVVHRWYFNAQSLSRCAELAGFEVENIHHVHRYPMANALRWLRDRKPTGFAPMDGIDRVADSFWNGYLEQTGKADCLYLVLKAAK